MGQLTLFGEQVTRSRIYFLLMGDTVKIGRTARSVIQRRDEGQTWHAHPLMLRGWIYGGERKERAIHAALADYRIRSDGRGNEWFRADPFVLTYIDGLIEDRERRDRDPLQVVGRTNGSCTIVDAAPGFVRAVLHDGGTVTMHALDQGRRGFTTKVANSSVSPRDAKDWVLDLLFFSGV